MEAKRSSNISLGAILLLVCGVPAILICYWALLIEYFKVTSPKIDITSLWKEDIFFSRMFFFVILEYFHAFRGLRYIC